MEYLNTTIIIGGIIAGAAAFYWLTYSTLDFLKRWKTKTPFSFKKVWKRWLLCIFIALAGMVVVQIGDNQRKREFTAEEIKFMNSGKSYDKFTDEDKRIASKITSKCTYNPDAEFEKCLPKVTKWEMRRYQSDNSHRQISDDDAMKFVDKDLRHKHDYWVNRKR